MPAARSASSDSDDGSVSPATGLTSSRLVRARLKTSPAATAAMAINPTPNVRIGTSPWVFHLVPLNQRLRLEMGRKHARCGADRKSMQRRG